MSTQAEGGRKTDPASEAIRARLSGVTVEITLAGCDPHVVDVIRDEYAPMVPSVPASVDVQVAAPVGADVSVTRETLRRRIEGAVADTHSRWGLIRVGATAVVDDRGSAMIAVVDGSAEASAALGDLSGGFEVIAPDDWAVDRSGSVLRLDGSDDASPSARPSRSRRAVARLVGAVFLGDGDGGHDWDDGILRLARQVIDRGAPTDRAPVLRAIQTIADSAPGIVRLTSANLPELPAALASWLEGGQRAPRFAASYPVRSGASAFPVRSRDDTWFRGPAHDYLERTHDVLVLRRAGDGLVLESLTGSERDLWLHASGLGREQLISTIGERDHVVGDGRSTVHTAFDRLQRDGLLVDEPSWAARPEIAYSASPTKAFLLDATARQPQPLALEGSAAMIWAAIVERPHLTLSEIVDRCAEHYDVDPTTIRPEVHTLLEELHRRDLIGWV